MKKSKKKLIAMKRVSSMADVDVSDTTFYSATQQIASQESRRQPYNDARKKGEVIANQSESGVPVTAQPKLVTGMKIVSKSGKSVSGKKTPVMGEMTPAAVPGADHGRQQALQQLVRERAKLMAAQGARKK